MRRAALLLLALAACAPKPETWAPVKKRLCADCWTAKLPFNVPQHGLALGTGGFRAPEAVWLVVDLDRGVLNRLTTRFDRQSDTVNLLTRKEEPLGARRARIVELANAIWESDVPLRGDDAPDVEWQLYLFDGKDARHDSGAGGPAGLAARLQTELRSAP